MPAVSVSVRGRARCSKCKLANARVGGWVTARPVFLAPRQNLPSAGPRVNREGCESWGSTARYFPCSLHRLGVRCSLGEVSSPRVPSPLALYQNAGWRDSVQKVPLRSSSFDKLSIDVTSTDLYLEGYRFCPEKDNERRVRYEKNGGMPKPAVQGLKNILQTALAQTFVNQTHIAYRVSQLRCTCQERVKRFNRWRTYRLDSGSHRVF